MNAAAATVSDAFIVAKRNVIKIKRVPDLLVFTTMSPIMFILLFAYVFGGAIDEENGGAAYREFLIAGIFAQNMVFGATITGAGLATDIKTGVIDRFRTLPSVALCQYGSGWTLPWESMFAMPMPDASSASPLDFIH